MTSLLLSCLSFAIGLGLLTLAGHLMTRPPRCPRCGAREWIRLGHLGPFVAYCEQCTQRIDLRTGRAN